MNIHNHFRLEIPRCNDAAALVDDKLRKGGLVLCLLTGVSMLLALTGCGGSRPETRTSDRVQEAYSCQFTEEPIKIDGLLDEPAWAKAKVLRFVVPETLQEPLSKTEARILYDRDYLYVGIKAYDQDIWSLLTERDSQTCLEDCLEIFFKTDPEGDPYYDFEINALGTVFDALIAKRNAAGNMKRWTDWNCKGLKTAIVIKGTLNNWHDKDEYWTLEAAIPFKALPTLAGKVPGKGTRWLFHLARYDYSVYLPQGVELSSCAPLSKVDFHYCEDWRPLVFE
jgi:hypothetical protein